jgi:hypothetical protein
MRAQVLSIPSIARTSRHQWQEEAELKGFMKALKALDALKECSMRETVIALENWAASGLMSEAEVDALFQFHGWERAQ